MNQLMNLMAMRSSMAQSAFVGTRQGIITAYDPAEYAIKASLQPTGEETGWIPLGTPWAGAGWGFAAGPMIGAEVEINFDSGTVGVGMAGSQFYNNEDRCPGPPSGELWLVHQSGALLKFLNSGEVLVSSETKITYNAPDHHFTGGNVTMDYDLIVVGNIFDLNSVHGSLGDLRIKYNGHKHSGVQSGSSSTNTTDSPTT